MLGRLVNEVIGEKSYRYPWGNILEILQMTDINLETTLTTRLRHLPMHPTFEQIPTESFTLLVIG